MVHRLICIIVLLSAMLFIVPVQAQEASTLPDFGSSISTESVMKHIEALAVDIGPRPMGQVGELRAAEYVANEFTRWGYVVEYQRFSSVPPECACEDRQHVVVSQNVIATKPGDEQVIVIGAHLDTVNIGTGAGDNASGVAAMLAAAEAVAQIETQHTVVFAAFGSNEGGCPTGSDYYIEQLGTAVQNVIAMINVDAVGIGTQLYASAGAKVTWGAETDSPPEAVVEGPTWLRDQALALAVEMDIPLYTTPAETWNGFTGSWGDHFGFVELEIPMLHLEAWQWEGEAVQDPWWGIETEQGDVLHTDGDIIEVIKAEQVEATAELLAAVIVTVAVNGSPNA